MAHDYDLAGRASRGDYPFDRLQSPFCSPDELEQEFDEEDAERVLELKIPEDAPEQHHRRNLE